MAKYAQWSKLAAQPGQRDTVLGHCGNLVSALTHAVVTDPLTLGRGRGRGTVTSQKDAGQNHRRCGPP
jgi:hypothetical protein